MSCDRPDQAKWLSLQQDDDYFLKHSALSVSFTKQNLETGTVLYKQHTLYAINGPRTWNCLPADLRTPSAPSSVISRPTCFSSSLRCCWQVGSAPFVRRRCDCSASSAPFINIQTYLLTYLQQNCHGRTITQRQKWMEAADNETDRQTDRSNEQLTSIRGLPLSYERFLAPPEACQWSSQRRP